jgi:L-lysine exporter family protein LysE/ArgO
MEWAFVKGMLLGGSLIIAIGAQNAFVLQHALRKHHHIAVAGLCSLIDAVLIIVGVWGLGAFIKSQPTLLNGITLAGVIFLFCYGCLAFKRALHPQPLVESDTRSNAGIVGVLATTAAISLLNPHVYLDTVLLLGSIGGQLPGRQPAWFAAGATTASFLWFFTLAIGGQVLAPKLKSKKQWQRLDFIIGCVMWLISASLLWTFIKRYTSIE